MALVRMVITADNGRKAVALFQVREDLLTTASDAVQDAELSRVSRQFTDAYAQLFKQKDQT